MSDPLKPVEEPLGNASGDPSGKSGTRRGSVEVERKTSTHFNASGNAHMVDITAKAVSARQATASASIRMTGRAAETIRAGDSRKGDVLAVARLAAIGASKWTSTLIPLCHAIPIEGVEVEFRWKETLGSSETRGEGTEEHARVTRETLECLATVRTTFKTGVEMEAMTAASIAALTVYDMLKSVDRSMVILETRLESKQGGKSGDFSRS